jgi:hypothetical protein
MIPLPQQSGRTDEAGRSAMTIRKTLAHAMGEGILLVLLAAGCSGCKTGDPSGLNTLPVADAGRDQSVVTGTTVRLDGGASLDPDGDLLAYAWTFASMPDGSAAQLDDPRSPAPSFVADLEGRYVLSLTVNDGQASSAPDTATIIASTTNAPPVAHAGPDQRVTTVSRVTLDGSASSDANGDPITYAWTPTSMPEGSSARLVAPQSATPSFIADVDGDYVFSLTVNDGMEDSAPDSMTVTATTANSAPVANAGPDQDVATGGQVELDGRASSDANGDELGYTWSFVSMPAGSAARLDDPQSATPRFIADRDGQFVAALVVNDGRADSAADTVTITASTANSAPVADAGPDRKAIVGSPFTLDGRASHDADGDALAYSWSLVSVPAGSTTTLDDPASETPGFAVDVDGTYVVRLVVSDGRASSAADSVTVLGLRCSSMGGGLLAQSNFGTAGAAVDADLDSAAGFSIGYHSNITRAARLSATAPVGVTYPAGSWAGAWAWGSMRTNYNGGAALPPGYAESSMARMEVIVRTFLGENLQQSAVVDAMSVAYPLAWDTGYRYFGVATALEFDAVEIEVQASARLYGRVEFNLAEVCSDGDAP